MPHSFPPSRVFLYEKESSPSKPSISSSPSSELWTTIVIRLVLRKVTAQTELLEQWLARVRGRPIDIYFEIEARRPNFTRSETLMLLAKPSKNGQSTISPMINLLAIHSLQWRHIEFHIPDTWYPTFTPPSPPLTDSDFIVADKGGATESVSSKAPLDLPLLISASLHPDNRVGVAQQSVRLNLTLASSLCTLSLSYFPSITHHLRKRQF